MEEPAKILTPAEYRQRAERCRGMATIVPATRDNFLMAAATWDALAVQAESLIRYKKQLEAPGIRIEQGAASWVDQASPTS